MEVIRKFERIYIKEETKENNSTRTKMNSARPYGTRSIIQKKWTGKEIYTAVPIGIIQLKMYKICTVKPKTLLKEIKDLN